MIVLNGGRRATVGGFFSRNKTAMTMGLTALVIAGTADLFAGLLLDQMEEYLCLITGMMILVYSAIGMRGNIFGAMGSRIGTSMNIGTFEMSFRKGTVLRANFESTIVLTLAMSIAMGFTTWAVAAVFFSGTTSVWDFVFISAVGGFAAGLVVLMFNILIAWAGNKKGWDVDNITAPLIAAIGDIVTMPMIFITTWLALTIRDTGVGETVILGVSLLMIAATAVYAILILKTKTTKRDFSSEGKRIIIQSLPVLLLCLVFEIGAGVVIQDMQDSLITYGVLMIMLPAFLNQGNALSGMLTSRLSSMIHLGTLKGRWRPESAALENFAIIFICAVVTFAYIGVISYAASELISGGAGLSLAVSLTTIMLAGVIATALLSLLSYYVAVAATKFGLDPDDQCIPITSSVMDLLGSIVLVWVISLFI